MPSRLAAAIDRRFHATSILDGERVTSTIVLDGVAYRTRLDRGPPARVAIALPCTDGFELTIKWNDRWANDGSPRAPSFDDGFLVETNDLVLAGVWLDHEARSGLLASRYVASTQAERATALMLRDSTWLHEVSNDEVVATRRAAEPSEDRMADMLMASLLLASRPVRWARTFGQIARELGGEPASRIELGGRPVLRVRRHAIDVAVRVMRRLGPGDPGRLRTVVSAHRHASCSETLTLISDGLPRSAWPPPADPSGGTLPIDPRAGDLLDTARPSSTTVRTHDVEIAFDGTLSDHQRLGAAIELAAWWASGARPGGPYR
jgi:hypothetical protein